MSALCTFSRHTCNLRNLEPKLQKWRSHVRIFNLQVTILVGTQSPFIPQKSDLQHGLVFNNPICELWNKIKIIKTCFILNECILNISVIHILSGRRRGCVVLTNEAEKKSFIYRKRVCKTSENETKINIFWFSHVKNLVGSSMCSAHAETGNQRSCGTAHKKKKKNYPSAYTALYQVCNTGKKTLKNQHNLLIDICPKTSLSRGL